jgi:hypothetical protein
MPGGGSGVDAIPEVKLVEPWSRMNAPLTGGKVTASDDRLTTVVYDGAQVDAQYTAWKSCVDANGFELESEVASDASSKTAIYGKKGKRKLTLTVQSAADVTTVTLARAE